MYSQYVFMKFLNTTASIYVSHLFKGILERLSFLLHSNLVSQG